MDCAQQSRVELDAQDLIGETQVIEAMDSGVGTIHRQEFARIFTTDKFAAGELDFDSVRRRGREIVAGGSPW